MEEIVQKFPWSVYAYEARRQNGKVQYYPGPPLQSTYVPLGWTWPPFAMFSAGMLVMAFSGFVAFRGSSSFFSIFFFPS
jgi:hypothetical protein